MEFLKGWNTVIFNALVITFAAIEAGSYNGIIPDQWEPLIIGIVGLVNMYLRSRTNTPIGRSE